MSKFRSPFDHDRFVPALNDGYGRTVKAGEVFDVPDDLDESFAAGSWIPASVLPVRNNTEKGE